MLSARSSREFRVYSEQKHTHSHSLTDSDIIGWCNKNAKMYFPKKRSKMNDVNVNTKEHCERTDVKVFRYLQNALTSMAPFTYVFMWIISFASILCLQAVFPHSALDVWIFISFFVVWFREFFSFFSLWFFVVNGSGCGFACNSGYGVIFYIEENIS